MSSGKLKSRPPREPESIEEFISGATGEIKQEPLTREIKKKVRTDKRYPWQASSVRQDISKVYNLRLPEPYLLKLKYIAEHTPESMQKFCLELLLPAIDAKIKKLTKEHSQIP